MAIGQSMNLSLQYPSRTQRYSLRTICPPSSADLSNIYIEQHFQRLSAGFSSCSRPCPILTSAHSSSAEFVQARSNPEANIPPSLPSPFHTAFRVAGLHVSAPLSVHKMLRNAVFFGGAPERRRRPAKCEAGTAIVREQMRYSNPTATVCRATASSCGTRRVSVRGSSSHAAAESHNFVEVRVRGEGRKQELPIHCKNNQPCMSSACL